MTRATIPSHWSLRSIASRFLCIAAIGLLLSGCSKAPPLAPLPTDAVVLAFGDSLTHGTGASNDAAYPAVLSQLISRRVVNAGVPGEVSAAGLARLPEVLEEVKPRLLILCHGGNDFLRKKPEGEAAANVRAMVQLARQRGIDVVLLATPKPGLSVSPPDFYEAIAKEFNIPIEQKVLREVLTDNSKKSDLVHPNAAGYRMMAEALALVLTQAGAVGR
ncbi:MAG: arylesterase [Burkholderiales bacterium]